MNWGAQSGLRQAWGGGDWLNRDGGGGGGVERGLHRGGGGGGGGVAVGSLL